MSRRCLPDMAFRRDQVVDLSAKMDADGQLHLGCAGRKVDGAAVWAHLHRENEPSGPEGEPGSGVRQAEQEGHRGAIRRIDGKAAGGPGGRRRKGPHHDAHRQLGGGLAELDAGIPGGISETAIGYDLLPYLPVLTGRAVESREVSERFLWDLRRMVADLLLENYAGHMREICHQHGLTLSIEAYGGGPLDEVAYGGRADVPMSEFWTGQEPGTWNKEMASSGHVYGQPVLRRRNPSRPSRTTPGGRTIRSG